VLILEGILVSASSVAWTNPKKAGIEDNTRCAVFHLFSVSSS